MFDKELESYLAQLNIDRDDFTSQEKSVMSKIVSELERTGKSNLLDSLWAEDYDEKPVSVQRFVEDDFYLGKTTRNGNDIWPAWREFLYNELFDPAKKYFRCLFTGAIGIGKSTIACIGVDYILYKLLCLKDPTEYYGLKAGSKPGIALFNVTLTKSFGVAFSKINTDCMSSAWFMKHGDIIGNREDSKVYLPGKDVKIVVGSMAEHFLGYDTHAALLDEVNFMQNKELDITKMKVYTALTTVERRMESRYMEHGLLPGMSFVVSSTRDEDDFMSQYRQRYINDPHTLIVQKPIYEIKPQTAYSGKKFLFAVGTDSVNSFIVNEPEVESVKSRGYVVHEIPIEYKKSFEDDPLGAIRDIMGLPTKSSGRFLNPDKIDEAFTDEVKNLVGSSDIKLGFYDDSSLFDYVQLANLNPKIIKYPMFVHHDLALTGDGAGMSITAVADDQMGFTDNKDETSRWHFIPVAYFRVRPKYKGDQTPFHKLREFVFKLIDEYGFNIRAVSADGYQSADMLQQYRLRGIQAYLISLDKAPCVPYQFFRTVLNAGKVHMPHDGILNHELKALLENKAVQKVDHPDGGSKDVADGLVGSIYCAVTYNSDAKNKGKKLFYDGRFTLADVIFNSNNSNRGVLYGEPEVMPEGTLDKVADEVIKEMQKNMFSGMDEEGFTGLM